MFNFLEMMDNYEDRKVARYEDETLIVDTCSVTDSEQPYETAVSHPDYCDGKIVIVEQYDTFALGQVGHDKWLSLMTATPLPAQLVDVSNAGVALLIDLLSTDETWRTKPRKKPEA